MLSRGFQWSTPNILQGERDSRRERERAKQSFNGHCPTPNRLEACVCFGFSHLAQFERTARKVQAQCNYLGVWPY